MKEKLRQRYTRKRSTTGLFFWVWGAISLMCLLLLVIFGFSQRIVLERTFKHETTHDLTTRGQSVQQSLKSGVPDTFSDESEYVLYLSSTYDVTIFLLDGTGQVLAPVFEGDTVGLFDFTGKIALLKEKLSAAEATAENEKFTVYQDGEDLIFGSVLRAESENDGGRYLYAVRNVSYMGGIINEMGVRTILIALFMFLLSFVVATVISGLFTEPIGEMTKKAKQLAKGDFGVDFHGDNYGKEMVELAESLNFARDELAKTDKMQKELIANVSHDFKTPLTMIKAYAEMIAEISGNDPEKRNRHAKVIVDESDRLTSLVNDLLDLSKLQSGISVLDRQSFDLSSYLYEVAEKFSYLCERHGYDIRLDVDDGVTVDADKNKIGQVLHNLIGNAVNYTGDDKRVFVSLKRRGNVVRFSVKDTGKGIPAEDLKEIWDRYYRSHESHKRPVQGTGLGLSIVRTVLEKHSFGYGVESQVGQGSTFYVDFPCP